MVFLDNIVHAGAGGLVDDGFGQVAGHGIEQFVDALVPDRFFLRVLELVFKVVLHAFAELVHALGAEPFGKLSVQFGQGFFLHLHELDLVAGFFADEFLVYEFVGDGDSDSFFVALAGADEFLDNTGDQRVLFLVQPVVFLLRQTPGDLDEVGDGLVVDGAGEVDHDEIILAGGAVYVGVADSLLAQGIHRLVDVRTGDGAAFLLDLEAVVLRQLEGRSDLERGEVLERLAVAELQLLDLRHDHRAQSVFLECLGIAFGHKDALDFIADLVAVGAHDVGQGRLSGPETGQVGVPPEVLGHTVKLGVDGLDIDLDAKLFSARGQVCNGYFHRNLSLKVGDSGRRESAWPERHEGRIDPEPRQACRLAKRSTSTKHAAILAPHERPDDCSHTPKFHRNRCRAWRRDGHRQPPAFGGQGGRAFGQAHQAWYLILLLLALPRPEGVHRGGD